VTNLENQATNMCSWKGKFVSVPDDTIRITDAHDHAIDEIKDFVCWIFRSHTIRNQMTRFASKAIDILKKYRDLNKEVRTKIVYKQAKSALTETNRKELKESIAANKKFRNLIDFYKKHPNAHPILMALFLEGFRQRRNKILRYWLTEENAGGTEQVPHVIKWLVSKRAQSAYKAEIERTERYEKRKIYKAVIPPNGTESSAFTQTAEATSPKPLAVPSGPLTFSEYESPEDILSTDEATSPKSPAALIGYEGPWDIFSPDETESLPTATFPKYESPWEILSTDRAEPPSTQPAPL
jgi:hypothetical protein